MSGHGWVTPNPDGSKARCGGPRICADCAVELASQQAPERRSDDARVVCVDAALSTIGLALRVCCDAAGEYYMISESPWSPGERSVVYQSIGEVEQFTATRVTSSRQIEAGNAYISSTYGAPSVAAPLKPLELRPYVAALVHYVSHGTPVRADGSQAFKSVCRAAVVTEIFPGQVSADRPYASLCVLNPTGQFFNERVSHDPGTFTGPEREAVMGEPLPVITCDDLTFKPGTWHWAGSR